MKKNKKTGEETLLEKYYLKQNEKKELVYMHSERMNDLKKIQGRFEKYMGQFDTIKGIDREKYINQNNLINLNQEVKWIT